MQISIALPAMAPQTTGHPAGLPADPPVKHPAQSVSPAAQGSDLQTGTQGREDQPTAPPSAIQRKIMELLEQQAKALDQKDEPAPDKAKAEDVDLAEEQTEQS